jgi:hypothetical protein
MKTLQTILMVLFFCRMLMAETVESVSSDSPIIDAYVIAEAFDKSVNLAFTDTSARVESADTSSSIAAIDTLPEPYQVAVDSPDHKKGKTKLIKRTFDSRQQVSLGIGMMIFIAVIMTTAQSWNPKN